MTLTNTTTGHCCCVGIRRLANGLYILVICCKAHDSESDGIRSRHVDVDLV